VTAAHPDSFATVEGLVRHQLAAALGGRRGMLEAALPTLLFTFVWLGTKDLQLALILSGAAAGLCLVVRIVQRSTMQFALNALFGIGIGWLFVRLAERSGGSADEQALAFFLPGILWSGIYSFVVVLTCLTGWPLIGFMLGGVTGEPTAWHEDKQVVQLCTRLTWVLVLPGLIGVTLQAPVWFAGWSGMIAADTGVLVLGTLRFGLGWPLRFAALAAMTWLLARDHTPLQPVSVEPPSPEPQSQANESPG
jgi:hypothetical protein